MLVVSQTHSLHVCLCLMIGCVAGLVGCSVWRRKWWNVEKEEPSSMSPVYLHSVPSRIMLSIVCRLYVMLHNLCMYTLVTGSMAALWEIKSHQ